MAKVKSRTHEARPAAKRNRATRRVARKYSTRHEKHVRHSKKGMRSASKARTPR